MLKYNKNLFSKNRCGIFSCSNPKLLFKSRKKISIIFSKLGFQLHPKSFEKTSQEKLNSFMQNINKELGPEMKSTGERMLFIKDLKDPYYRKLVSEKSMYLSK